MEGLEERIAQFSRWHYAIDLGGIRTPIHDERLVNRHEQRRRYFFEPLVELCGGSLEGRRVLDLGCNAGFWSLSAIDSGCSYVLGLDARAIHIEQAELVFEARGIAADRYAFRQASLFDVDLSELGPFDVVLCLGLLYHVEDPIGLFRRLRAWSHDLLVIDTSLSLREGAGFELRREPIDDPRNTVASELVLRPTRQAARRGVRLCSSRVGAAFHQLHRRARLSRRPPPCDALRQGDAACGGLLEGVAEAIDEVG